MRETNPAKYRITDVDESERLLKQGAQALSNAELIAILLRVGMEGENAVETGQRIMKDYGGIQGLHRFDPKFLEEGHGLGAAKVATLKMYILVGFYRTLYICVVFYNTQYICMVFYNTLYICMAFFCSGL